MRARDVLTARVCDAWLHHDLGKVVHLVVVEDIGNTAEVLDAEVATRLAAIVEAGAGILGQVQHDYLTGDDAVRHARAVLPVCGLPSTTHTQRPTTDTAALALCQLRRFLAQHPNAGVVFATAPVDTRRVNTAREEVQP